MQQVRFFKSFLWLFVMSLIWIPLSMAGNATMSSTNAETGETTTIVKHADGSKTITVTDSSGHVISQGPPTGPLGGLTGAYSDDPATGKRYVSVKAEDSVIHSESFVDPETGMTIIVNELDPSVDDGRAQYVINPDGTQESLVGLPGGTNAAVSVDPKTGKKYVALGHDDGTIETYVINPDGTEETIDQLPKGMNVMVSEDPVTGEKHIVIWNKDGSKEHYVEKSEGSKTPEVLDGSAFGDDLSLDANEPSGDDMVAHDAAVGMGPASPLPGDDHHETEDLDF